jgi:Ca-activated chloride channel family protein
VGIEDFHFLRAYWLLALPFLGFLVWYWFRRTQEGNGWEGKIDSSLLHALIDSSQKRSGRMLLITMWLAAFLSIIGAAGPAWQKLPQDVEQKQDTLVILLDLSLSMLATDVQPSRLERARQKVADVLRTRIEGETALVAYAGDAHTVVPLTDDVATIENLLFSLSPEMMPVFGSNADHALELAHELFENSGYLQGRILIITDGIDSISSVTRHRNAAYPISVLGIGTEEGSAIPLDRLRQPGRFLLTQEGNRIIAQLDPERLSEVAGLSYGRYHQAEVGDQDIAYALDTALPSEDETIEVEREFDTWADQGHWFAVLLLPFLLLTFRRGVLMTLLFALTLPVSDLRAQVSPDRADVIVQRNFFKDAWDSLWYRADQRGLQKFTHGQPEHAAVLFEEPQWKAAAQYRSGEYARALDGFSADSSEAGFYNQGNAFARLGEYENSIAAYDRVLTANPEHENAAFNKELVARLLQEKQESDQQDQDQQSENSDEQAESDQEQQSEEQQDESEQSEEQQEQEQQSQQEQKDGEQQETEETEETASRDEKQEALEQWLRRVPDDPGGLLRRKFSHETRQRLRGGEYENRETDKQW